MRIKSAVLAVVLALAALTTPMSAGAQTGPIPCPGGDNGWFPTVNGAVNCSWDGNHIVADVYGPGGTAKKTGAVELWYSWECNPSWSSYTGTFQISLNPGKHAPGCFAHTPQGTYNSGTGVLWQGPLAPCIALCGVESYGVLHRSANGMGWNTKYSNGGVTWLRNRGIISLSYGSGYAGVSYDANNSGTNSGADYRRMALTFKAVFTYNNQ